jgi:erythromycin esterase-like protein
MIESITGPVSTANKNPRDLVISNLHEVYHTQELAELFHLIIDAQITVTGLEINGADLVKYNELKYSKKGYESRTFRDKVMFQNLNALMNGSLRDKKVIIWAHNNHIMKKPLQLQLEKKYWESSFTKILEMKPYV